MPLLQILCEMEQVEPELLLDGDIVYYKTSHQQADYRLQGPFRVIGDSDPAKYKLSNCNGGSFFLNSIAKIVKFYKKA